MQSSMSTRCSLRCEASSGVVRILKDLDREITDKHVLVVEDIIDSGLTLNWLLRNMRSRGPATVEVCALFRKPEHKNYQVCSDHTLRLFLQALTEQFRPR